MQKHAPGHYFEPINYANSPSCPAPWSSLDDGETWVAGNYFMTLQRYPLSASAYVRKEEGEDVTPFTMPILYPYAMLVFHKTDKEHPKVLPILVLTIEITNLDDPIFREIAAKLGNKFEEEVLAQTKKPTFFCMFQNGAHLNYGPYSGSEDPKEVTKLFFKKLEAVMEWGLVPQKIGTLRDAVENPKTGLTVLIN